MRSINWLVDGDALQDKPRQGGTHALKGFTFQAGIALVRLTWLLTCRNGLVRVRYDGAQDIDLRYADDTEVYIQAKNYGQGNFDLQDFYKSLGGFARDVISAKKDDRTVPSPQFHLMLTSIPTQDSAIEFIRRSGIKIHGPAIVGKIQPKYRHDFNADELLEIATNLFENTKYIVGLTEEPSEDLAAIAGMELVRFGVRPECVDPALDHLLQRLQAGASFYMEDVAELLAFSLPERHPASPSAPMRLLPGKGHLAPFQTVKHNYYHGQPVIWQAIAHDLDITRKELATVEDDVLAHCHTGGMVVVTGPAGSGKSSLIHRAAWNLHHRGAVIAVEVKLPGNVKNDDWQHITRLLTLSKRPVLLIVDDVWRHNTFFAGFEVHARPRMVLLASSRPGEFPADQPSFPLCRRDLGKMEPDIKDKLQAKLGVGAKASTKDISRLLDSGQILALSLHLQQLSLERLAASTLASLNTNAKELYLDLCVAGMFDLSTPAVLIIRRAIAASAAWPDKNLQGLVFETGSNDNQIQVGHALLADAVVRESGIDPVQRVLDLCAVCQYHNDEQKRYATRLLRYVVRDYKAYGQAHSGAIVDESHRIAEHADFADFYQLETILKSVGENDAASAIVGKTSFDQIKTSRDVSLLISLIDSKNFDVAFPILFGYYSRKNDLTGFRRFIYLVRRHGKGSQLDQLAALADAWLPQAGFPSAETTAWFDLLVHQPDSLLPNYAPVVGQYVREAGLKVQEPAMAAIRLADNARIEDIARTVFDAALEAATHGVLQHNLVAIHEIARMASRRLPSDVARLESAYKLLRGVMPMNGSDVDLDLIRSLAHVTPRDQAKAVRLEIEAWPQAVLETHIVKSALNVLAQQDPTVQP